MVKRIMALVVTAKNILTTLIFQMYGSVHSHLEKYDPVDFLSHNDPGGSV
jgi:hypothetical protein